VFWVISIYLNIRNTHPKSGTLLLGHPVCVCVYIYIYIYIWNVYLILNIEKIVDFFLYSQTFHPTHTVDPNLPTFVVSMEIVCAVSKLGTHNCHSTVILKAAMLYIRFWYLASLT
jgi:hypothetical protein